MTRTGPERLWMIGGVVGACVLLAIAWFFLIGPQNAQTDSLNEQATAATVRLNALHHRLSELQRQNADLSRYEAQLALDRQALPTTSGMADFLRELQAMGDSTGVSVGGLAVGAPTHVPAAGSEVYALPLTLTAAGGADKVSQFLDQLQTVQPRAVLITSVGLIPTGQGGSIAGAVNLTLNLRVYVAPPPGAAPVPSSAKTAK